MGTCNFSKVNASRYYVIEDNGRDWEEIKEDLQFSARERQDGKRFRAVDEVEAGARWHRDEGRVILEFKWGDVFLSRNYCFNLFGKIIVRPGYYEGATLDWDFEAVGWNERFCMNDYDDLEAIASDIFEDWDYCELGSDWNAGIKKMQAKNIRKKIDEALEGVVNYLEEICAYLVGDNIYQRVCVFSNGEAVYQKETTERGRLLAAAGK